MVRYGRQHDGREVGEVNPPQRLPVRALIVPEDDKPVAHVAHTDGQRVRHCPAYGGALKLEWIQVHQPPVDQRLQTHTNTPK